MFQTNTVDNQGNNTSGPVIGSRGNASAAFDVTPPAPSTPVTSPNHTTSTSLGSSQPIPTQPVIPSTSPPADPPRPPRGNRRAWMIRVGIVIFALLLIGVAYLFIRQMVKNGEQVQSAQQSNAVDRFGNLNIPLSELSGVSEIIVDSSKTLSINGQLKVNNNLVISPSTRPTNAVAGQMYYDQSTNQLSYYNGSGFIEVGSQNTVASIGGISGAFTLGDGFTQTGTQISNSGVLTVQGQSGNVSFTAGNGIAINGTTISTTGVSSFAGSTGDITIGSGLTFSNNQLSNGGIISVTSASAGLTVTNDGAGNITLSTSGAGTGTVQSPGGTAGRIAKFTGVQTIEDSLLSESGTTVTVNGDLAVTGALSLGSPLPISSGGTGATTASTARTNLGAATSGANNDITSLSGLTTALSVSQGGTGVGTLATNGVLLGNGTSAISSLVAGASGLCLLSTGGAPAWQACPSATPGVATLDGLTGNLILANSSGSGSTITIDDASTTQKGIVQFNGTNFSVSGGVANTIQNINTSATPTFAGINTNSITPSAALTVGATTQNLTLQGATTTITSTSGANVASLTFVAPTANVTYRLQTAAAGTYDVCTTAGNCTGVGGGVSTPGGTTNALAKFTGSQTIADSIISDNGTVVTVAGDLHVTGTTTLDTPLAVTSGGTGAATASGARSNLGAAASGANSDITSLSGLTTALSVLQGGTGATSLTANGVLLGNGTSPISSLAAGAAGQCLVSTAGAPTWSACPGSGGVTSVNSQTGVVTIANASGSGGTVTINDASTSQKGIAQFNSTNFTASSGTINTIQNINTSAAPTFGQLTLTSSQASGAMLTVNNTNVSATGNLLDLQLNGSSRLAVAPSGAMTIASTINGQTISSSANFTGTLTVAGAASLNGGATVTGTLTANTITPSSSLTVGATSQSFLLQGNASSTITATNGANTTTVAFQSPTANVTYRFLTTSAGTYDVCTTAGNCVGTGGGVSTPGGTNNTIAKFTGSQTLGNSIITDDGSTVTIGGTLAVNTITPSGAMTIGATGQNLTLQGASVSMSATSGGITNTLTFATPATSNKTITIPNASGTIAVSASGPLSLDANGNLTCPTCVTSGGGGGGVAAVDSLNGLTGALTLANASGSGTTITINDASTSQKGIAQFNSTNFTASSGVINTIQNINTSAAPTFGQLTLTSSQATAAMLAVNNTNISATGNLLDLQLNGTSRFSVGPNGDTVIAGNVTSGTINGQTISSTASFTGSVSVATTLSVNTITPTSTLTIGATGQDLTLQGAGGTKITATSGGITNSLVFATPATSNKTITIPNATGTVAVSASGAIALDANGNITCPTCVTGSAVTSLNSLTGALTLANASAAGSTITINDASTSQKGIAQFNSTNFTASSGTINTIQNINTTATPTFGQLTLSSSQASAAMLTVNNTNVSATGNLIDLQLNGSSRFAVSPAGALTLNSTINGQTISSTANFTGSVTVGTTLNANVITPSGAMTIGATGQSFTLQGNASSTITATGGSFTTTVGFSGTPVGAVVYNFDRAVAAGTYTICSTAGNCAGIGGGVTTVGGTTNKLAKFTGSQTIGDSIITDNGSTVTIGGGLIVNSIQPNASPLSVGVTNQDLTLQGAVTRLTATDSGVTNTLTFATPTTTNKTITIPDATGTVCLQNSTSCGFAISSGSTAYIQNQSASAQSGNFFIQSASASAIGGIIRGANSQSAAIFEVQNSAGAALFSIAGATNFATLNDNLIINGQGNNASTPLTVLANANQSGTDLIADFQRSTGTTVARFTYDAGLYLGNGGSSIAGYVAIGNAGGFYATLNSSPLTANRTISLPNEAGTICIQSSTNCGFAPTTGGTGYIQNQNAGAQTSSNFWISGSGRANTSFLAPTFDVATAAALTFGTTNATSITMGKTASNIQTTVRGTAVFQTVAADTTTAFQVQNSGGSTILNVDTTNTSVDLVTLTVDQYETFFGGQIDTAFTAALGYGTSNASKIDIGHSGINTTVTGNLIQQTGTFSLTGNGASSLTTTTGSLLLQSAGSTIIRPSTNSTTAVQIQNASSVTVLDVDTTNRRVGINDTAPGEALSVVGNLEVKDAATATKGYRLRTSGGSLDLEASGANLVLSVWSGAGYTGTQYNQMTLYSNGNAIDIHRGANIAGDVAVQGGAGSFNAFRVNNSSGVKLIGVDSNNSWVSLGNATTTAGQNMAGKLLFADGTLDGFNATLQTNTLTADRTINLPNEAGTLCIQNSTNCGFAPATAGTGYIQNQNAGAQATSNFWISGTGRADVALQAPAFDVGTAAALTLGATNATGITIGKTGITNTVVGGLTQSGGAVSLTGNAASTISTTSGTLTMQSVDVNNNIVINGGSNTTTVNTGTGGTVTVGSSGTSTVNIGAQTNNARTINIGYPSAASQAQTINMGALTSTSSTTIQGGTGSTALNLTTGTGGSMNLTTAGTGNINLTPGAAVLLRPATDSETVFRINGRTTNNDIVRVDSTNERVGIGVIPGTISAKFSVATSSVTALRAYQGGTNNLVELGNATADVTTIDKDGFALFKPSALSTTAFRIQNTSSVSLFTVDTTNARLYVGPTAGDTVGTLLVLGNKTNAGDPTGVNGAMYYSQSYKAMRCYQDDAWSNCSDPTRLARGYNLQEEFFGSDDSDLSTFCNGTTAIVASYGWSCWTGGTATTGYANMVGTDSSTRPGQVMLATGANAAGNQSLYAGAGTVEQMFIGGGETFETAINIPTLSTGTQTYVIRVGLCDDNTHAGDCTDGVYFEYSSATSANWRYATATAGTRTKNSSTKAVATGWTNLKFVANSSTSVTFYAKSAGDTSYTNLGTITTNIPASSSNGTGILLMIDKTVGTTERTFTVDYVDYWRDFTTTR